MGCQSLRAVRRATHTREAQQITLETEHDGDPCRLGGDDGSVNSSLATYMEIDQTM